MPQREPRNKPRDAAPRKPATARKPRARSRSRLDTRENILQAAVQVFAQRGLAGGRIERISHAARSNDRMIYYYFGSKEKLFVEVLETVYREMWEAEAALELDASDPVKALTQIIHFTLDHYLAHPEMITLLNSENLHKGKHVSKSRKLMEMSHPALAILEKILQQGVERGLFRAGVRPLHLYLSILALNYFYLSNSYTLSAFIGVDLLERDNLGQWRQWVTDMILRSISSSNDAQARGTEGSATREPARDEAPA